MNFIWINVTQIALAYTENPNSIYLSIQKLFKKQWRTFLKNPTLVNETKIVRSMNSKTKEETDPTLVNETKIVRSMNSKTKEETDR